MRRHVAYSNLDRDARLVLDRNEAMKRSFMGDEGEPLDQTLEYVLSMFWLLRRTAPSDRGLPLSYRDINDMDPRVLDLLLACDGVYMEEQSKRIEKQRQALKSKK